MWAQATTQKKSPSALQSLQQFWATMQPKLAQLVKFFRDKKNDSKLIVVLAIVALGLSIYFLILVVSNLSALKQKIPQLRNLNSYDTTLLQSNALTRNFVQNANTLDDLLTEHMTTKADITTYSNYLASLQIPYTYFLQYMYLPSLNIRRNPYTQQIDPDIIGLQYLQKNPYNDITLLQKRSDFFKNVGDNNESNDITDINIGDITEDQSGYFSMPITVSFVANSKRAFLLLTDKLSMTSNRDNISLIDEFFYYLRQEIKKDKAPEIKILSDQYAQLTWFTDPNMTDKTIAYHLYNRIFNNQKNILVDKAVIDATVKSIIACNNQSDEICYYQFREKYRNIPTFGNMIGTNVSSDPAQNLKDFVLNLPPVFSLKEFTFDKVKSQLFTDAQAAKYNGKVTIQVYGRGVSASEIDAIAGVLGHKCFQSDQKMSADIALQEVNTTLTKISNLNRIDKAQSDSLRELKANLEKVQAGFAALSPYKKTIKLFEVYRMINEAGLCK